MPEGQLTCLCLPALVMMPCSLARPLRSALKKIQAYGPFWHRMQKEEAKSFLCGCAELSKWSDEERLRCMFGWKGILFLIISHKWKPLKKRKYPLLSTLLWRTSICILPTNHLLIQWDHEVGFYQHIQLPSNSICRGDAKCQCLKMNLLAFQGQTSLWLLLMNLQSENGRKI